MNRWIEAVFLDLTGQESKQKLTRKEKMNYSLYLGCACFALGVALMFVCTGWYIIAPIACFITGGRKLQIYWNKRKQWEKEAKDYDADT